MSELLLSICIPTYNRHKYLVENIEVIISQITPDLSSVVELCVVDNASTDDTVKYLAEVKARHPEISISYKVNPENLGADGNFKLAMAMGRGTYSWLFGSDDALCEGALLKLVNLLNENPEADFVTFNRFDCDINLEKPQERFWMDESVKKQIFDFSDKYQEAFYYSHGNDVGSVFSFISTTIFRSDVMTKVKYDPSYDGTQYSFLYYFITYLKTGIKLLHDPSHYVLCRVGNSFLKDVGLPKRLDIDFTFFIKIKNDRFKDDENGSLFLNLLKKTHPYYRILSLYCTTTDEEWKNSFAPKLKLMGWSNAELNGIKRIGSFPNLYQSRFKQKLKAIKRSVKSILKK
jgi:abequosyltransferase